MYIAEISSVCIIHRNRCRNELLFFFFFFSFELRFLLQYRLHYPVATYTMRKKGSCDSNAVCDDLTSFFLFYPIFLPPSTPPPPPLRR